MLVFSLLVCALPMLLGLRLWERIPAVVETGLTDPAGNDDSMPRAVLVFGVPGLMCVLNLICHVQLWLHQKTERIPPLPIRIFGRWGFPVLSVLLSSLWMLRAAGEQMTSAFLLPCILALLLLLLGTHFFDCPPQSKLAFRLRCLKYRDRAWEKLHRTVAVSWMTAGLLLLLFQLGIGSQPWYSALITLLLLLLPFAALPVFIREKE
ncbi:MAG: hypothetical protein K6C08_10215 [Oscillospiraceae bacterium]|nr:hypothetical protein [Oscillospiraceae bacterium]